MMRLRKLNPGAGAWSVLAEEADNGACELVDDLQALLADKKTKATGVGFYALWSRIPSEGPRGLGTALYHQLDPAHDIYEFIKGNHRILCFSAGGRVVVCSHVLRKKRQTVAKRDIEQAIELRRRYLEAEQTGQIVIEE